PSCATGRADAPCRACSWQAAMKMGTGRTAVVGAELARPQRAKPAHRAAWPAFGRRGRASSAPTQGGRSALKGILDVTLVLHVARAAIVAAPLLLALSAASPAAAQDFCGGLRTLERSA